MKTNWELNHLGHYVNDLDKTLDYYVSLGIAIRPSPRPTGIAGTTPLRFRSWCAAGKSFEYLGRPIQRIETVLIGSLALEVLQPLEYYGFAKEIVIEYLDRKGEGISHIAFTVPDPKVEMAPLTGRGCEVLCYNELDDGACIENYLETSKFGNIWLSMFPPPGERMKAWMSNRPVSPVSWKFRGVGVGVRDVDRTAEYYDSLGITTVESAVMLDSSSIPDFKVNGKTPDTVVKTRTRTAQIGPVVYEFIQPLEGEGIYRESLNRRGEGVNDIVFTVDDLEKETARLVERGAPLICSGKPQTGGAFEYFDTRKDGGGIMIKLVQEA